LVSWRFFIMLSSPALRDASHQIIAGWETRARRYFR
jgi:hypothetical protein